VDQKNATMRWAFSTSGSRQMSAVQEQRTRGRNADLSSVDDHNADLLSKLLGECQEMIIFVVHDVHGCHRDRAVCTARDEGAAKEIEERCQPD